MTSIAVSRGSPMTALRLKSLGTALLRIVLVAVVGFMAIEAVSSARWIAELQADRINRVSEASPLEDHLAYYAAGRLVLGGAGDELYERDSISAVQFEAMGRPVGGSGVLPYFNPPFAAAALAPLAAFDVPVFSTVLLAVVIAIVVAGGVLCSQLIGIKGWQSRTIFWIAYLSLHATTWMIAEIQLSALPLLGWIGFVSFQVRGEQRLAGLALCLVLVKPQMVILPVAYLLWQRQWAALLPFGGVAAIGALVSIIVSGPGILLDYPIFLMNSTGWEGAGVHVDRMFGWNSVAAAVTGDASPSLLAMLVFVLPTLALASLAIRAQVRPSEPAFLLQASGLILATLLINPHLYRQDLVLLVPAVGLVFAYAVGQRRFVGVTQAICLICWFIVLWGPGLVRDHSLPIVPLTMAILLIGSYLLMSRKSRSSIEESRTSEAITGARLAA